MPSSPVLAMVIDSVPPSSAKPRSERSLVRRLSGTKFAEVANVKGTLVEGDMSLVRLLGFTTLSCGCVVGRYREVATSREVTYVEEKGKTCGSHGHRRNHTIAAERYATTAPVPLASKAS